MQDGKIVRITADELRAERARQAVAEVNRSHLKCQHNAETDLGFQKLSLARSPLLGGDRTAQRITLRKTGIRRNRRTFTQPEAPCLAGRTNAQ